MMILCIYFVDIANDSAVIDKYSSPPMVVGSIGKETSLRYACTGYPMPSITWTLPNGDSKQTRLPFLIVKPMTSEDFGQYTASAMGCPTRNTSLKSEGEHTLL